MNSKSQPLYFVVMSLLSTAPAFQNAGVGTCLTSSNDIALVNCIQRSAVDYASASFVEQYTPSVDYKSRYRRIDWFPKRYWDIDEDNPQTEDDAETLIENSGKVLACASGLRAEYDYSELIGTLRWSGQIETWILQNIHQLGNGECNYRHLYPIYYEDVYKSDGYLSNSYGY